MKHSYFWGPWPPEVQKAVLLPKHQSCGVCLFRLISVMDFCKFYQDGQCWTGEMAQPAKHLLHKLEDWSLDPEIQITGGLSIIPACGRQRRDPLSKLTNQADQISKLWIQVKDLVSVYKVESDRRRYQALTSSFYMHAYTHVPMNTGTRIHVCMHAIHMKKRRILSVLVSHYRGYRLVSMKSHFRLIVQLAFVGCLILPYCCCCLLRMKPTC